jgi:hypothetical protein
MKYRVDMIPKNKSVFEAYPELKKYDILTTNLELDGLDNDFVLRYLILLFGVGSPFVEEYPELTQRKAAILRYLGVEPNERRELPKNIENMATYTNPVVLMKAVMVLRLSKSSDWQIARACEEKMSQLNQKMLIEQVDVNAEKNLQQTIELNRVQLEKTLDRLTGQENSRLLQEGIMSFLADESLGIRPEEYMDYYAQHGTVFPNIIP